MRAERWKQIEALFEAALERPPVERAGFVRERAAGDEELAERVLGMLRASEHEGSPLDGPAPLGSVGGVLARGMPEESAPVDRAGDRFGPFQVERLLAAGGMGEVYLCRRVDGEVDHRVAIKVIRDLGGRSASRREDARRRFLVERQALASLRHPYITSLLDVGTTDDGQPYLVMEYVEGEPIDAYCQRRSLGVAERVRLFVRVCEAVQHAHHELVIHRDIKPQNILVTPDGVPKVLDFGIARLLEPEQAAGDPAVTRTGEFLGTLVYAVPEQLRGESRFDTRSDVYSLGVALYAVLTGRSPFQLSGPLSGVLKTLEHERPEPASSHNHAVGADLDAVVACAMARDRDRRYQSAGAMADDLGRVLTGEPVAARADSRWYVLRSEIRRRRTPLAAGFAVLLASVLFGVFATTQAGRLRAQADQLSESLYRSTVERARLLGNSGNVVGAERLLWDQVRTREAAGAGTEQALWGLRELYSRHPLEARVRLEGVATIRARALHAGRVLVPDPDSGSIVAVSPDGAATIPIGSSIRAIDSGASGRVIAWLDDAGGLWVADSDSLTGATRVRDDRADADAVAVSPSGERIGLLVESRVRVLHTDGRWAPEGLDGARGVLSFRFVDDARVLCAHRDGVLALWDTETGSRLRAWDTPSLVQGRPIAVDGSGSYGAVEVNGSDVQIVDLGSERVVARLGAARGWIVSIAFGRTARGEPVLAAISADKSLRVWRVPSWEVLVDVTAHADVPTGLIALDQPGSFATTDSSSTIRFWSLAPAGSEVDRAFGPGTVHGVAAGRADIAVSLDGAPHRVELLDANSMETIATTVEPCGAPVSSVQLGSEEGGWIASSYDGEVFSLRRDGSSLVRRWTTNLGVRPSSLAVSGDGSRVGVACDDGSVRIVDARSGAVERVVALGATRVPSVSWSPRADLLAAATYPESDVHLITPAGEITTLADRDRSFGTRVVRFGPDGRTLAVSGDGAGVEVWRLDAGGAWEHRQTFTGHREGVFALAFSPDGDLLASAGRGGRVLLWDLDSGMSVDVGALRDEMIFALAFSSDGRRLISAGVGASMTSHDLYGADGRVERHRPGE